MKVYLLLVLSLLLLLGCAQQGPSVTPSEPSAAPTPSPSPTPQPTPQPPPTVTKPDNRYVVSAAVLQFDQQLRYQDKRAYILDKRQPVINLDNITKSYGIAVEISDVSSGPGTNKPIKNPEKAAIKLISPDNKEMKLKYNSVSQADYDQMPALFKWIFFTSDTPDPIKSRYAYFNLNTSEKLKGVYKLVVDIEGDGEIDGEREIIVPGLVLTNPVYGSNQSTNGFDIQWNQAGKPQDFVFGITLGYDNLIPDDSSPITNTKFSVTPQMVYEDETSIEPGMQILNIQIEGGKDIIDKDAEKYMMTGKSDKKVIFQLASVKEAVILHFKVGDFCHCDDLFEPKGSCSVDELDADPLC